MSDETGARAAGEQETRPAEKAALAPTGLRLAAGTRPASAEELERLRRFHFLGDGATMPAGSLLPALLWALRDPSRVRTDYPLLLPPATDSEHGVLPLSDALSRARQGLSLQGEGLSLFDDNALRFERCVRRAIPSDASAVSADDVLTAAAKALLAELSLRPHHEAHLSDALEGLRAMIPAGSQLLGVGSGVELSLLAHAVGSQLAPRREAYQMEVSQAIASLEALLEVDDAKLRRAREPSTRESAFTASSLIDPEALSRALGPHRGSTTLSPERRARIERTLEQLRCGLKLDEPHAVVVRAGAEPAGEATDRVAVVESPEPLAAAMLRSEELVAPWIEAFRALRVAKLELQSPEGGYDSTVHDAWLAGFERHALSEQERELLPIVVVVEDANALLGPELARLSLLLRSGRRIMVMARARAAGLVARDEGSLGMEARLELGYLAMSFRELVVHQSSVSRPQHLHSGLARAVRGTSASLHVVGVSDGFSALGGGLEAGAAVEARALPLFLYDASRGGSWARRLQLHANPQPETDFPLYPLECSSHTGAVERLEVSFCLADYALLRPELASQFVVVEDATLESPALVPIHHYLALAPEVAARCIPYVWAASTQGELVRAVVSQRLVLACRDRLDFWRTLQELAGIHNEHVQRATEAQAERLEREATARIEALQAEHREQVERVRIETAAEALGKLAAALVCDQPGDWFAGGLAGGDTGAAAPVVSAPQEAAVNQSAEALLQEGTESAAGVADEDDDEGFDEPWIDSGLCTSCNDCINLNPRLFVYNSNKQATIADVDAGTFEQLVTAAEKCPAKCIHPGKPANRNETDLDELVARAAKFN